MNQPADISRLPHPPMEHVQFAGNWWYDDKARPLPGEECGYTVFVIDFYDGCKYFGCMKEYVAYRAAALSAYIGGWGPNFYVQQQVPYVVRCIKSNLNNDDAKELRDMLVAMAPENVQRRGNTVQTANCWVLRSARMEAGQPPLITAQR